MHQRPENAGALFQVASQFNLLEMVSPGVTPEQGVTRYEQDHTQGPACAITCGAATIYRNYFAPVDGRQGQTETRQFDGLYEVGVSLSCATGRTVGSLWDMKNGYALCSRAGLDAISQHIEALGGDDVDALRGKLWITPQHRGHRCTGGTTPVRVPSLLFGAAGRLYERRVSNQPIAHQLSH